MNHRKKGNSGGGENTGNEFIRMRPKNIIQDKVSQFFLFVIKKLKKKEKLYEETLHLKTKNNDLKDENTKLKARLSNMEVFSIHNKIL